jgi:uncharacterized coiled-coil DUF342 family protein
MIYRNRLRRLHIVRSFEHAKAQFEALIGERDYWKSKAREAGESLSRTVQELNRTCKERDHAFATNRELVETNREARAAQQRLIECYEQREEMRRLHEFGRVERDPVSQRLH